MIMLWLVNVVCGHLVHCRAGETNNT